MIDAFIAIGICGLAFWMGYSINQGAPARSQARTRSCTIDGRGS